MGTLPAALDDRLEEFELRQSDDEVKTDLEVTCVQCDAVICDAEHSDTLGTLVRVVLDHQCADKED